MAKTETLFDWAANLLGIAGGIPMISEKLGKAWSNIPEPIQKQIHQRMPGFLGLSLEDEAIFDGLLIEPSDIEDSIVINNFLAVCADYEANRFRNVVARMEVVKGSPKIIERKFDQKTKKTVDGKVIEEVPEKDRRRMFLKNFAHMIQVEFEGDYKKAYAYCIGGGLIKDDPLTAKVIRAWSKSCCWFKKIMLDPFSANSFAELKEKLNNSTALNGAAAWIKTNINQKAPKYKGIVRSGLPTKRLSRWAYVMFIVIAVGMVIYGLAWG